MNAFEEYCFGNDYILRFYRVDHGLICTINESMVAELRAVEAKINQQQAEIEALKRPNNVVGVPCDELKKMQDRLAHLEKMIVWYQDITMTGSNSTDYENGFWDAVDFVKWHQVKDKN